MQGYLFHITTFIMMLLMTGCMDTNSLDISVYETSANGNKLTKMAKFPAADSTVDIIIQPEKTYQMITGFGGSFTESSAYLLNRLSKENRKKILEAYFGESGARYSLTRTHINSCDFSLEHYSYDPVKGDRMLKHFSIDEDRNDLIPMIKDAMAISKDGFKIISSPWTAPPWMKDNHAWEGGKLLPEYYGTWALYFSKYLEAYKNEGIDIWGITVENEPLGNDSNWESMLFTPQEMNEFVKNHLGPRLQEDGHDVQILGYDQNRGDELKQWVDEMYGDEKAAAYYGGTAVHWYASTYEVFARQLQYAKKTASEKHLIQTEATVDAEVPRWKDDSWYWNKDAKDWGWDWAPADQKYLHPKYVPVFRYVRDMIGTLNNWVDGWIDWNMVLDRQGGPNLAKNWCVAPVIVDPDKDEVYFTPLYFTMAHFSRFIRPGAIRIGHTQNNGDVQVTAAKNPDGSIAVVLLNQSQEARNIHLQLDGKTAELAIDGKALQTINIQKTM